VLEEEEGEEREGGTYAGHEKPESAAEGEAHAAGHDGFGEAGLHACLHLEVRLVGRCRVRACEQEIIPSGSSSSRGR
jgi:metal-dependent amidase/aminoacylase/carboxypeptidase family protein